MSVFNFILKNIPIWRLLFVVVIISLLVYELYEDLSEFPHQISISHIFESIAILLLIVIFFLEIKQTERMRRHVKDARAVTSRLSGKYVQHINQSFEKWNLTQAENEIAWLLLKGFSFSEIAVLRGVLEKTLRQQATRIYSKANVNGRIELVGYFMEDFLTDDSIKSSANDVNNKA